MLQPRVLIARDSYNQGFLPPGVSQPGVLTSRVVTTWGPYILGVLTIRGSSIQRSYKQGFLQPGVLQPTVLTSRGSENQRSYNMRFLNPRVLEPEVLASSYIVSDV